MNKKNNKPKIRFKNFIEPWKKSKISELLVERNEQAPKNDKYPLMAFIANEGVAPKGERYDRGSLVIDEENKKYKRTLYGDFIYSSNNLETGSIGLNRYGNASISPVYSIFKNTDLSVSEFIGQRLTQKDFINQMVKWRQGVIYGQWRIHESDFIKLEILVPNISEQQKIGEYFSFLDNLIKSQQQKLEKLKNIKKSMLDKMFPKNGSQFPEIRFKGYTTVWKKQKLGEIGETYSGLSGKTKEDFGHGCASFVTYMNVYSNPIANADGIESIEIDKKQHSVQKGDVFFTTSSETPEEVAMSSVWMESSNNIYLNSFCFGFHLKEVVNNFYMAYLLRSSSFRNEVIPLAQGISRYNISKNKVMDINICLPDIKEQEKIGTFFSLLDNLIKSHQQKLEKLKNIKKSFLEKMFV